MISLTIYLNLIMLKILFDRSVLCRFKTFSTSCVFEWWTEKWALWISSTSSRRCNSRSHIQRCFDDYDIRTYVFFPKSISDIRAKKFKKEYHVLWFLPIFIMNAHLWGSIIAAIIWNLRTQYDDEYGLYLYH